MVTNAAQLFYCAPDCTLVSSASDPTIVLPAVPTLPEWAMIVLVSLFGLAGVAALRRRPT